ncbi:MAG: TraR/DksA C4-type zinc finger protein [Halofilum sp. (in: g-proteobacteria)]|nr:TraR/DksA C4-type zinc finger protein [Halofilum sp. (in: g-proteobacteria)]
MALEERGMAGTELDREHFRRRLLELCEALEASQAAGDEAASTVELDQQRQGRLSRMDALGAQAMSAATQRRRGAMLARAQAALARLDEGEFGICAECGEPIDPRRLEFDPTVELCIACARSAEEG